MVAGTSAGPVASFSSLRRASTMAVSSPVLFVAESAPIQRESATVVQTGPYSSTSGEGDQEDSSQTATPHPAKSALPGTGPAPSVKRTQRDGDSNKLRAGMRAYVRHLQGCVASWGSDAVTFPFETQTP